ncbi:histone H2B type W-T-like [Vicugna pacos]|uniref:Histone H2B type W-T-like n=1 Tax=Vicugna pacos TaxID=30538 RepID=A0ABM5CTR9_VICPA
MSLELLSRVYDFEAPSAHRVGRLLLKPRRALSRERAASGRKSNGPQGASRSEAARAWVAEVRPSQRDQTVGKASDSNIAEPWSSRTSEEIVDTEERKEAESKSPEQKMPKQKTPKQETPVRRQHRRRRPADSFASFASYFGRVLKRVHTGLSLSQEAVSVMDSFVKDIFERIASEAARLARSQNRVTITYEDIQTSVCLLLPGEIGECAMSEGTKAVIS